MTEPRRTLGIDPGTARLGYAVVEERSSRLTLRACDCITTPAEQPLPQRLLHIFNQLQAIIAEYQPRELAIEELFFGKNATTAVNVGQARGVALLAAAQAGLSVSEYKPLQVKQAVHGYGSATKQQVGEMVKILLGLASVPKPDDAADAAAIAICHLHTFQPARALRTR